MANKESQSVNVTKLPTHTKKEVIVGKIFDVLNGKSSGFTTSADLRTPPPYGYMVGGLSDEYNAVKMTGAQIRTAVDSLYVDSSGKANIYFGAWRNPDNGSVIFELSEWCESMEAAQFAGSVRKQLAIYDLYEKKDVAVDSQHNVYTRHEDY